MTSVLGTAASRLGNIVLGAAPEADDPLDQSVSSTLTITDAAISGGIITKHQFATLPITHSVFVNTVYNRSVTSTLTLTDQVKRVRTFSIADTLVLSQVIAGYAAKKIVSTIVLTQSVVLQKVINRTITSVVSPLDSVARQTTLNLDIESTLNVQDTVSVRPVKFVSASNTLTITDEALRQRYERTNSDLVDLGDSVTVKKVINLRVSSTLAITDTPFRNIVINRSLSHTITFAEFRIVPYRIGDTIEIVYPTVSATKVHPRYMVLSVAGDVIVLPAPEFGDRIGNTDQFTMSMAKTGKIYTTIKRSMTKNLNYEWDLFANKGEELKEFIWRNNSKSIKIENWKGEIWFARMLSNPIDFRENLEHRNWCGGKVNVSLDFEGVRIH